MEAPSFQLDGRTILVTGAGSGIGQRMAQGLAEFGASVGCLDLSDAGLGKTVKAVEAVGGKAISLTADVTEPDQLDAAIKRAEEELGPLRGAVNCAGILSHAPTEEMPRETLQAVVDVCLVGVFLSCAAEARAILSHGGGGSIVNIGSISATIANRGLNQSHYNASKAGVVQASRSLGLEWADRGIRVNALSPGYTATPMAKEPELWEQIKHYADDIPLGRFAEPVEMVGPAVFLLSDAASYCTGSEVLVDGGAVSW